MKEKPMYFNSLKALQFTRLAMMFCLATALFGLASRAAAFTTNDFGAPIHFDVGGSQEAVAAGDLDGDGKVDIVSPNYDGTIVIFKNTGATGPLGSGSFAPGFSLEAGGNPMGVVLADVDGDGKLDIVTATRAGTLSIFRNISSGGALGTNSFAPRVDFPVGSGEIRS